MTHGILKILLTLHVLCGFIYCQSIVEPSSQAFVQTDNELRYMVSSDGLGIPLHEINGRQFEDININHVFDNVIIFEPALLEFEEQPIGMPYLQQVTIQNRDETNDLHLLSISGSTLHFHCSFFNEKVVSPGDNTTFEVVFLARQVGNVENTLYIHTNVGIFKYQVFGVGIPNPYRIRPILGAKVPLNTSFTPLIKLHNPHSSVLQIKEIYSSGGDLHLQLPNENKDVTKEIWKIPPYDTKPIMKANFLGRVENNHTAFIRIRTNKEKKDHVLVLPLEVEVSSEIGIYSTLEMLDFGIVRSCDDPKTLKLNLINSGVKPLHIHEIYTSPPNNAVHVNFRPIQLKPDLWEPFSVAVLSFNASKAKDNKQWSGRVVIRSKTDNYELSVPYQASVLQGSLSYKRNKTMFYSGQPNRTITRSIPISNYFTFTLAIHNASVPSDVQSYFSFDKFKRPVYIKSGETVSPFILRFNLIDSNICFRTKICLYTNASTFYIPLYVYNGKLKPVYHRPELFKGQMDFGTIDMLQEYSMLFTIRNENPVDIVIRDFGANLEKTTVTLLGIEKGNGTTLTSSHQDFNDSLRPVVLKSNHFAVFNLSLTTTDFEGTLAGELIFYTQYENLYIPVTMRTTKGSLKIIPERLVFERCFPGKVSYLDLRLVSTFEVYMAIKKVVFQPNDTRFYYKDSSLEEDIVLEPQSNKNIGRLYFDPRLGQSGCGRNCYVGLPSHIQAGHLWARGCMLRVDASDIDHYLYTRFKQKWAALTQDQTNVVNLTIQFDTNQIRGFLFQAQAHMYWPSLRYNTTRLNFPLTQIGNTTVRRLVVENPSDMPVIMQFLPLYLYPNPQTILDLMEDSIPADLNSLLEDSSTEVFSLYDLEKYNPHLPNISTGLHRGLIEQSLGVPPHPETVTLAIGERTKVRLRVGFSPVDHLPKTSLLVIRNNLTIMDVVVLHGYGGQGDIKFGNRKVGSTQPLLFEITEKILKNCDKKRQSKSLPPNFTVRKSFTTKNCGQLPFYVQGFSINNSPCEGYGFKVLDCSGFELQPNVSKKVDIVFTPDFTMSRIQRILTLHTSLGPELNYTLQATIPAHLLNKCSAALPRPLWEPLLYYSIVCVMGFFLFCILVASYFEADRIFTTDLMQIHRSRQSLSNNNSSISASGNIDQSNVFNLRAISSVGWNGIPKLNDVSHTKPLMGLYNGTQSNAALIHSSVSNFPRPHSSSRKRKVSTFFLIHFITKVFSYFKIPKLTFKLFQTSTLTNKLISNNKVGQREDVVAELETKSKGSDTRTENSVSANNNLTKNNVRCDYTNNGEDITILNIQHKGSKIHWIQNDPDLISVLHNQESKYVGTESQFDKNKYYHDIATRTSNERRIDIDDDELYFAGNKKNRNRYEHTDDASSTTTDSSIDVLDDKISIARDSTPEQHLQKGGTKKGKKKSSNRRSDNCLNIDSEVYLVTSGKSKTKKIKIDCTHDFDGHSLTNCEYDLPYMMKDNQLNSRNIMDPELLRNKPQGYQLSTTLLPSEVKYEEQPLVWDQPKYISPEGDLSDLCKQTQLFEKQHKSASVQVTNRKYEIAGESSVSSANSSIFRTSNKDDGKSLAEVTASNAMSKKVVGGQEQIPVPNSKIYSEAERGWSSQISPLSISSGQQFCIEPITETCTVSTSNSVSTPSIETKTAAQIGSNLGLQDLQKIGQSSSSDILRPQQETGQPTIMQQLLQERRKRQLEYQQKVLTLKEEWPFFNTLTPQESSFWDASTKPLDNCWSNSVHTESTTNSLPTGNLLSSSGTTFWDDSAALEQGLDTTGNWSPIGSVWSSGETTFPTEETNAISAELRAQLVDISSNNNSLQSTPPIMNTLHQLETTPSPVVNGGREGFNPFNTLGSIWNPISIQPGWDTNSNDQKTDENL